MAGLTVGPAQVLVTRNEAAELQRLSIILAVDPTLDVDGYVLAAQELSSRLPVGLRRALLRFRRYSSESGGLLIRGLPLGEVPPTPPEADKAGGVRLPAARIMSLISATLGDQFGFMPELSGQIVQDILPVAGFEDTQHSISSRALLQLHCETSFTDNRADFIGLLCLRPDPEGVAGTLLSPAHLILPQLDPRTVALLRERRFVTTVDGSFLRGSGATEGIYIGPISVLNGSDERPRIRCDFAETRGIDREAHAAIEALHAVASAVAIEVRLDTGDLLFIDNHAAFHGRTPFSGWHNGKNRWLLRTFVTRDLARSGADRPMDGRIVDADYAAAPDAVPLRALAPEVAVMWVTQEAL